MNTRNRNKTIRRTWLEAAGWTFLIGLLWGTDLVAKILVRDQEGVGKNNFLLISEQVTSAIAALIMVLFVLRWLKLFPLTRDAWAQSIVGHTVGTILFAFGHYTLMVTMRLPWYALNSHDYIWREPFVANLIVEYQKDIKIYFGIVVIATLYQMYRRSRSEVVPGPGNRLLVQTGSGERIVRFEQIDYLEAARNYVSVHAEGREYVIRDTMANVMQRLAGGPFLRTHRSFIVNADKVKDIRSIDSKQRVYLHSGDAVPLSRSYREEFTAKISG